MTCSPRSSAAILVMAATLAFGQGKKPLTTDDLIQMQKAGFDEQTMVKALEANGAAVDTSAQGLMTLKNSGLSDAVIRAALSAGSPKATTAPVSTSAPASGIPEDVGAYLLQNDLSTLLPVEVAKTKTGGMLKSMATFGVSRVNVSGSVTGTKSSVQLRGPVNIILRCPDGTTPEEHPLLILEIKKDRRDFTTGKLGFRASVGVDDKNVVATKFEKIARNTYRTSLTDLKKGEYGIFFPSPPSPGSPGKLYTFGVLE